MRKCRSQNETEARWENRRPEINEGSFPLRDTPTTQECVQPSCRLIRPCGPSVLWSGVSIDEEERKRKLGKIRTRRCDIVCACRVDLRALSHLQLPNHDLARCALATSRLLLAEFSRGTERPLCVRPSSTSFDLNRQRVTHRCWSSIDREFHAKTHRRTTIPASLPHYPSQDDHLKGRPYGRPPR